MDLTYQLAEGMPSLPYAHHPLTEITQIGRRNMEGSDSRRITFGTHTGTHMDLPGHMLENVRPWIGDVPLERLIGPAKLLRLSKDNNSEILPEELEKANLHPGDKLLISTGWGKMWGTKAFYFNYPSFSLEAVNFLVEKKVGLVGMDIPAPDVMGLPADSPAKNRNHKTFFRNDILIIEAMANLDLIPVDEFQLIALPLKAEVPDGFPVRAVAVCR